LACWLGVQALAYVQQQQQLPPPLPAAFDDEPLLVSGAGTPPPMQGGIPPHLMSDPGLLIVSAPQWGQHSPQQSQHVLQQQEKLAYGGWGPVPPSEVLHGPPALQQAAGFADVPEAYFADLQRRMAQPGTAAPGQQEAPATRAAPRLTNRSYGQQQPPPPPPMQQQLRPPYWPASHGTAAYPTPMSPQVDSPNAQLLQPGMQPVPLPAGPLPSLDTRLAR
jgi:hypothetical protein